MHVENWVGETVDLNTTWYYPIRAIIHLSYERQREQDLVRIPPPTEGGGRGGITEFCRYFGWLTASSEKMTFERETARGEWVRQDR